MACPTCGGAHPEKRSPHTGEPDLRPCFEKFEAAFSEVSAQVQGLADRLEHHLAESMARAHEPERSA